MNGDDGNGSGSEDLAALAESLIGRKVGIEFSDDGKVVRYMTVEEARKRMAEDAAAKISVARATSVEWKEHEHVPDQLVAEALEKCVAAIREQFAYADKAKVIRACSNVLKSIPQWPAILDTIRARSKSAYNDYSDEKLIEEVARQALKQAAPKNVGELVEASIDRAAQLLKSNPVATPEETVPLFREMWGAGASAVVHDFIGSLRGGDIQDRIRRMPPEEAEGAAWMLLGAQAILRSKGWSEDLSSRIARVEKVASQCVVITPNSPQNFEVLAMSLSVFLHVVRSEGTPNFDGFDMTAQTRRLMDSLDQLADFIGKGVAIGFLGRWRDAAFARLEISHKLAAALCLTDIVDSEDLRAPWSAWSLLIPDGLFGENAPARVWIVGKTPVAIVYPRRGDATVGVERWADLSDWSEKEGKPHAGMILALVLGACAALSDPERIRKTGCWGRPPTQPKHHRHGAPPEGSRYILAQPVLIDLRATVIGALNSGHRSGGSPKVQFLVRGHWRNQAHGPARTLRTFKWIEPFWKGPPDTRILLRSHKVKKK